MTPEQQSKYRKLTTQYSKAATHLGNTARASRLERLDAELRLNKIRHELILELVLDNLTDYLTIEMPIILSDLSTMEQHNHE